ncbi:MAG: DUF438 domain-containing protein [Nitrososphaeria archaeon]|nr:DUF438 domain-containing protein [Nitrososphaeria archaeon]
MEKEFEKRKEILKKIIRELHAGASPEEVKVKFASALEGLKPEEVAKVEEELVKDGLPREEIRRLCDIHLQVFKESLDRREYSLPEDHPIKILMEEHKIMIELAEKLVALSQKLSTENELNVLKEIIHGIEHIAQDFVDSEKHYLREENVLFPLLEKHGITEPPAIMWMEHNQIREKKRELNNIVGKHTLPPTKEFASSLENVSLEIQNLLKSHFYKENNILFPTSLNILSEVEWATAKRDFDEIGYCCFTPPISHVFEAVKVSPIIEGKNVEGVEFETGSLTKEEIEAILNALPVDITFVDANDSVKYFNKAEKRIFVRTKSVLGRKVQMCHPQKSIHIVNKILDSFRKGEKDVAEFWITMNGRFIHIRYFPVRDKNGKYLGTMEVTQDVTEIRKLEGEKRLLDWKE